MLRLIKPYSWSILISAMLCSSSSSDEFGYALALKLKCFFSDFELVDLRHQDEQLDHATVPATGGSSATVLVEAQKIEKNEVVANLETTTLNHLKAITEIGVELSDGHELFHVELYRWPAELASKLANSSIDSSPDPAETLKNALWKYHQSLLIKVYELGFELKYSFFDIEGGNFTKDSWRLTEKMRARPLVWAYNYKQPSFYTATKKESLIDEILRKKVKVDADGRLQLYIKDIFQYWYKEGIKKKHLLDQTEIEKMIKIKGEEGDQDMNVKYYKAFKKVLVKAIKCKLLWTEELLELLENNQGRSMERQIKLWQSVEVLFANYFAFFRDKYQSNTNKVELAEVNPNYDNSTFVGSDGTALRDLFGLSKEAVDAELAAVHDLYGEEWLNTLD